MQYKKKVFVSDLWNFLKEQNIIDKDASHLDPETFIFYIEQLKAKNAKDKAEYHDFALKCLKGYIENNPSWRKDIINLQALLDFDPELDEYDKPLLFNSFSMSPPLFAKESSTFLALYA
jgi:hypothetical protein